MQTHFTKHQIETMTLVPNKILVKPTYGQHKVQIGDMELKVDFQFSPEKHAPVTGIVSNICSTLIPNKMPWETKHEIKKGDYIVYSFESATYALDPNYGNLIIDEDNEPYLMIDYEDIFVVRRNDQVIPVNGYILVSPIDEDTKTESGLITSTQKQTSGIIGKVEYVGTRNECYYAAGKKRTDVYDFHEEVKVGHLVVFGLHADVPLEYEIHPTLQEKKRFFRMQRRDILHILENELAIS